MMKILMGLAKSFVAALPLSLIAMIWSGLKAILEVQSLFFSILAIAIIIDLLVGVVKYIKLNKFSFRKLLIGFMIKVLVAYGGMFLFLSFATLEDGPVSEWFLLIAKFTILLYPAGSAFSNMHVITGGKFPPIGFMKKLEAFDNLSAPLTPVIEENIEKDAKSTKS